MRAAPSLLACGPYFLAWCLLAWCLLAFCTDFVVIRTDILARCPHFLAVCSGFDSWSSDVDVVAQGPYLLALR
jgi:hypothetical protein